MPKRKAQSKWQGTLKKGKGKIKLGSGAFEGQYSFRSRFKEGSGTNPEELIGAAHSGCFAMALSKVLEEAGYPPDEIDAEAGVKLENVDGNFKITAIELTVSGKVPGVDETTFQEKANDAKENCPVSQALSEDVAVSLQAELV
ncbi:MAG: OsmC family peroxiredoxin [Candidatus Acetothermia bacterium]